MEKKKNDIDFTHVQSLGTVHAILTFRKWTGKETSSTNVYILVNIQCIYKHTMVPIVILRVNNEHNYIWLKC